MEIFRDTAADQILAQAQAVAAQALAEANAAHGFEVNAAAQAAAAWASEGNAGASAAASANSAAAAHASELAAAASAIAASAAAGGGAVKISATDTIADYLVNSLSAGSNIALTVVDAGANETLRVSVSGLAAVATSGAYADLSGEPALGSASALNVDTDGTMAANSDTLIPSQKAVKTYVAANTAPDPYPDIGQLYLAVARLDTPTSPNLGGTQVADEFDDGTGISSLGGATVTGGYLSNQISATVTTPNSTNTGANWSPGYTRVDTAYSIANGVTVTALGVYSLVAGQFALRIYRDNGSNSYTVYYSQIITHGGGGWQDFALTPAQAIPGSGTYRVGSHNETGATVQANGASSGAYYNGDVAGTGTMTADNYVPISRYTCMSAAANITAVSTAYAAAATPSTISLVVEYQDIGGTAALNTDITFEVSRGGGTTWTAVTMSDFGPSAIAGARVLKGSALVSAQPAGTSVKWRIKTFNAKVQRVHGVWMQWK